MNYFRQKVNTNIKLNIAILFGGISSEREVSIKSAIEVASVLDPFLSIDLIELNHLNFSTFVDEIKENTLVFNALHGGEGENGQIQSFLSQHGIPHTGSESMASMLAMNKHFTKIIALENDIQTPNWLSVNISNTDESKILSYKSNQFTYPVVVKPNFQGSTLGLSIVKNKDGMKEAINLASIYSDNIIVEKFIKGRELTVGILGGKILEVVEIIPNSGFYDYSSKYTKGATRYICPANIEENISKKIKENALQIHNSLNCRHYSRVDFLLCEETAIPYMLEINTLPGLCSTSLLPISAKSSNIDFKNLVKKIIKLALIDAQIIK